LERPGARFLTNDRVIVSLDEPRLRLRGMPTVITIRPSMLDLFPGVARRLASACYDHRLTLREAQSRRCGPPRPWSDGRIGLSPAQFCDLLAVTPTPQAEPCALLFPHITRQTGGCVLRALPPRVAGDRLTEALFAARWLERHSDLFVLPRNSPAAEATSLAQLCQQLAAALPCLECRLGTEAYDPRSSAGDVIERAMTP
jgi:hypothetical protein